jgi:glycosyltransferase involved in cell wall biosynthesis
MTDLRVSVITPSFNSSSTIADTIKSVAEQSYSNIEYIIVDGNSSDRTVEIGRSFGDIVTKIISEPDSGLYDAINKGIKSSKGDIVGVLNADDFYNNNLVVEKVVDQFNNNDVDAIFGDVLFVSQKDIKKTVRYYSSEKFIPEKFKYGFMPAHPSFYVRRDLFDKLGYYKTDYKIASDYELLIRFIWKNKIRYKYLHMPFVSMRTGGISNQSLKSYLTLNKEIVRACRENGIYTNYLYIYPKYFLKVFEYIKLRRD